jgi:hypothetical protein
MGMQFISGNGTVKTFSATIDAKRTSPFKEHLYVSNGLCRANDGNEPILESFDRLGDENFFL